jgi:hypothetical protein
MPDKKYLFKTTRKISIQTRLGRELATETQVYDGNEYQTVNWTVREYDELGRLSDVCKSDGRHLEYTQGCCNLESETSDRGIVTDYTEYDDLGRLFTKIKRGTATIPDITSTYTYNAVAATMVSAGC